MAMHQSIAVDMLYKATLGSDSYRHPEWVSFAEGFNLPCRNGFRFTEVWFLTVFWTATAADSMLIFRFCDRLREGPKVSWALMVSRSYQVLNPLLATFLFGQGLDTSSLVKFVLQLAIPHSLTKLYSPIFWRDMEYPVRSTSLLLQALSTALLIYRRLITLHSAAACLTWLQLDRPFLM
jgi:hypothetical protein